jgi:hypothetical protein
MRSSGEKRKIPSHRPGKPVKRGRADVTTNETIGTESLPQPADSASRQPEADAVEEVPQAGGAEAAAQRRQYVKSIEQRSKAGATIDAELLAADPVYRIMRQTNRSDMLEIVRCKFGDAECVRAAKYGKDYYSSLPLRHVRLQLGLSLRAGLFRMLPLLHLQRHSLRLVDLSRNVLTSQDIAPLCAALGIDDDEPAGRASGSSQLEVLDLSCNRGIGDAGTVELFERIRRNRRLRAVILKFVGLTDDGAVRVNQYLRMRPEPLPVATVEDGAGRLDRACTLAQLETRNFFVNLNENCIGEVGIAALGKGLPDFVSLTAVKQRILAVKRTGTPSL